MDVADARALLRGIYGGRRWIVAADVLAGVTPMVASLSELGAESCLCVAGSTGTGDLPDASFAPDPIVLGLESTDMMAAIRVAVEALADLPPWAVARIDTFDPERRARVIGPIFDDGRPLAGRAKWGARQVAWQRLEDKVVIDELWDAAGVDRAPSRVVPAVADALSAAGQELDRGEGTVWAGDAREGFNGGASYLRWVRGPDDAREAAAFFGAHCSRVRVMPFLEGIACSIHGIAFEDRTAVFRPCEMLVFRRPGQSKLQYAQAATFWDPAPEDREQMREVGRRVSDHLRRAYGYRGMFTVDGVMTASGFRPTELNPRFGAAAGLLAKGLDLPLVLLNAAVVEGEPVDWQPDELERIVVAHADGHRHARSIAMVSRRIEAVQKHALTREPDGRFRVAADGDEVDATAMLGPSASGGILIVELVSARTPIGPSVAPRMAEALRAADLAWELGIGPLEPARDVRASSRS